MDEYSKQGMIAIAQPHKRSMGFSGGGNRFGVQTSAKLARKGMTRNRFIIRLGSGSVPAGNAKTNS
jgi:hypothetical protein